MVSQFHLLTFLSTTVSTYSGYICALVFRESDNIFSWFDAKCLCACVRMSSIWRDSLLTCITATGRCFRSFFERSRLLCADILHQNIQRYVVLSTRSSVMKSLLYIWNKIKQSNFPLERYWSTRELLTSYWRVINGQSFESVCFLFAATWQPQDHEFAQLGDWAGI